MSTPSNRGPARIVLTEPAQLQALSSLPRQRILGILTTRTATLSGLAGELGLARASVSYHLKILRRAGCVREAGTSTVRGGVQTRWTATAREFDLTAFASELGMPAQLLRQAADELHAADHRDLELTRTRRVRVRRADFDRIAAQLNALFDELDRLRIDGPDQGDGEAGDPGSTDDCSAGDVHSVTLAAAFFRNTSREESDG